MRAGMIGPLEVEEVASHCVSSHLAELLTTALEANHVGGPCSSNRP